MQIQVTLPRPHHKQAAFINSPASRKLICSGRRAGKTTGVAILAAQAMLAGRRVLYAAPTDDQTEAFWQAEKRFFAEVIQRNLAKKNETKRFIELGQGRIRAKTSWDADTLRGDYADLLILEEYSLMDPSTWNEVGAPMLLDNGGDAVFIGTPKRRNHFYQAYLRAQQGDERWQAWHFTSFDNPYLSKTALNDIISDMTADAYRQEIMAEFLEGEGAVFRNIAACLHAPETTPEQHAGHRIVGGADWGKQVDRTALALLCTDCGQEVALDIFNQIDYHVQRQRLEALHDKWRVTQWIGEQNSIGEPILEELQRDNIPIVGFITTATSKPPLIESLALALERAEVQWLNVPVATTELEAYERRVSPQTGRSQYSAPDGIHDDTVIARALALRGKMNTIAGALMV